MAGQSCPPPPLTLSLLACQRRPQRGGLHQISAQSSPGVAGTAARLIHGHPRRL